MTTYRQRQRALRRLALIALAAALIFSWLLWYSATASTVMLLRLHHDQDRSATVTPSDIPASGVEVMVTETICTGQVCAASPVALVVVTDSDGYASVALEAGTEYSITAPCVAVSVVASDVGGAAVRELATCGRGVWLPMVAR